MNIRRSILVLAVFILSAALAGRVEAQGLQILYVTPNGKGECTSWIDACTLQVALTSAQAGEEIWVSAGTYTPGSARTDSFYLKSGVPIYGGFKGGEDSRDSRNWQVNKTILSGEIGEPGIDGNSYNVVNGSGADSTAILDGFTITGGNESRGRDTFGGGVYIRTGNPHLNNLIITQNNASWCGGGMGIEEADPILTNVLFYKNTSEGCAGALHTGGASPTLTNVTFFGNSAKGEGGAIYSQDGNPTLLDCIVWGDSSINSEIIGNITVRFSDVRGGYPGTGNVDVDPMFINAEGGNLRLLPGSQVIDRGDNTGLTAATDLDGNPRLVDFWTTGKATVDMGAYEAQFQSGPERIYVDVNAPLANQDGTSWAHAYRSLQSALAVAHGTNEIWVADGTYVPGPFRDSTFQLRSNVSIYGGFAGNENSRDARDFKKNLTFLSGEIGAAGPADNTSHVVTSQYNNKQALLDGFIIQGGNADTASPFGGGMYIQGGNPTVRNVALIGNTASMYGGGMAMFSASPTLENLSFEQNSTSQVDQESGGGLYSSGSDPQLLNVRFLKNTSNFGGGMAAIEGRPVLVNVAFLENTAFISGGGLYLNNQVTPPDGASLSGIKFEKNLAKNGGGLAMNKTTPDLVNISFTDNQAEYGGGVWALEAWPIFTQAAFTRNTAINKGGGLAFDDGTNAMLNDVLLIGNSAADGGGIYNTDASYTSVKGGALYGNKASSAGGGIFNSASLNLVNVVFSGNTADQGGALAGAADLINVTVSGNSAAHAGAIYHQTGNLNIHNTIVWGNRSTTGPQITGVLPVGMDNILQDRQDPDPRFSDADGVDGVYGTIDDDLSLQTNSPAVDEGSNAAIMEGVTTDLIGSPRVVNGTVDMGAYELLKPIYVNDDAKGDNTGETWQNAYTDLQSALSQATAENQVWAAEGAYYPSIMTDPYTDPLSATFRLKDGQRVYGGFAAKETSLAQRRWRSHATILSGDFNHDGTLDGNSYSVVTATGSGKGTLDGFIIEGGNGTYASGSSYSGGAGIIVNGFQPSLRNLVLRNNKSRYGGAMYVSGNSSLTFENLTFLDNEAWYGGALYNASSALALKNVVFVSNAAVYSFTSMGGGLFNASGSSALLMNVVFDGNSADTGGALASDGGEGWTNLAVINGTFYANTAESGSSISNSQSDIYVKNSILWGDGGLNLVSTENSNTFFAYSLIEGSGGSGEVWDMRFGTDSGRNIDATPFFLDAVGADNTPGTLDDNLHLSVLHSPAVDAGSNNLLTPTMLADLTGFRRIMDGVVDMGAYESANTTWLYAEPLSTGDSILQRLTEPGQSRWYKVPINPDDKIDVDLTDLPKDYDLALLRDLEDAYKAAKAEYAVQQGVSPDAFAPDAFAPDAFAPDAFAPDAFAPDAFAPDAFAPDAFAPDAFAPDAFAPDAFAPDAFAPDAFAPDAFAPDAFAPDAFAPDAFAPDAFAPDAFAPEGQALMTQAQRRSVVDVSNNRGTLPEEIKSYVWKDTGYYYIRVKGYEGAFSQKDSYRLSVEVKPGACTGLKILPQIPTLTLAEGNYNTLVVADFTRLEKTTDLTDQLLTAFLIDPRVNGALVDVSQVGNITTLNAQAETIVTCAYAKNLVAEGIKQIIDQYRAKYSLQYIVLLGSDYAIPFFRYPDFAEIGMEKTYNIQMLDATTSKAAIQNNLVLSQDDYGADTFVTQTSVQRDGSLITETIVVPGLAVGRLVETPAQIAKMLDVFLTSTPQNPGDSTALVAGYDFLADAASTVLNRLTDGGVATTADSSLIYTGSQSTDSAAWNASTFTSRLMTLNPKFLFIGAHSGANGLLSAKGNYTTDGAKSRVWVTKSAENPYDSLEADSSLEDLLAQVGVTLDLQNTLAFSAGCHAGYNMVDQHNKETTVDDKTVILSPDPDWAEFFASQGATWVSGTGFQYGNTDMLLYSERLYANFTTALRPVGTDAPVPVGKALVNAKRAYLCQTDPNEVGGTHTKTMREVTLYGLPMATFALDRNTAQANSTSLTPVSTTLNGAAEGLKAAPVYLQQNIDYSLILKGSLDTYYAVETIDPCLNQAGESVFTVAGEPVLPLVKKEVTAADLDDDHHPDQVARGVLYLGGNYAADAANPVTPLIANLEMEGKSLDSSFTANQFFPADLWTISNTNLLSSVDDGRTFLDFTPVQHQTYTQDPGVLTKATRRLFTDAQFTVYYMDTTSESKRAMLLAIPAEILTVQAWAPDGGMIHWAVQTSQAGESKAVRVVVTYTFENSSGAWLSQDLDPDLENPSSWAADISLNGRDPSGLHYIVQVVSDTGLVTLETNNHLYFSLGSDPNLPPPADNHIVTALDLALNNSGAIYEGDSLSLTATLTGSGSPVAGQIITLKLGGAVRSGFTDADGRVTTAFEDVPAGSYSTTAEFDATVVYQGSQDFLDIEVDTLQEKPKDLPVLTLEAPAIGSMTVSAILTNSSSIPLSGMMIVMHAGSDVLFQYTDGEGRAYFVLEPGTYPSITASFAKSPFEDSAYSPVETSLPDVNIFPIPALLSYTGETAFRAGSEMYLTAQLDYDPAVPSVFPRSHGLVLFEVRGYAGQLIEHVEAAVNDSGFVEARLPAPAPGIYSIILSETGPYFTAGPVTIPLAIYDPAGASLTGGGWYDVSNQKANFNLNVKYPKNSAVPSGSVVFQFGKIYFQSSVLDYLAASATVAQVKGTGTVNGKSGYGFLISIVDGPLTGGRADRFRIKIWDLATNAVVYDNQPGSGNNDLVTTVITGGDITIHK